jgi:acyl-CoA dehydrogenase
MNFGFTEEQEMLRAAARRFLDAECPPSFVRRMMDDPTGHAPALWKRLVQLGWTALLVPEADGGLGGSFVDLLVVLQETGRTLLPGPFRDGHIGDGARRGDRPLRAEPPARVARGSCCAGHRGRSGRFEPELLARAADGGYVLYGTTLRHGRARRGSARRRGTDGRRRHGAPRRRACSRVAITPARRRHDPAHPAYPLRRRDGAAGRILGGRRSSSGRSGRDAAIVAEMVGTAQALDRTVAYVKGACAAWTAVGSSSAVKHQCVDMLAQTENALARVLRRVGGGAAPGRGRPSR